MNKATKAVLFSALLFPGWGQIYLKRYIRGLFFILPVLAGTLALAWAVVQLGAAIIKAAPFKNGTVQMADIIGVTVDAIKAIDLSYAVFVLTVIFALWILSIVDAYWLSKKIMASSTTDVHQEASSDQA